MSNAPPPSKALAIALTSFAAFGGFLYGFDTGNISGIKAMPYFLTLFGTINTGADAATVPYYLPSSTDSLITSILSAGTFFGALAAYPAGDYLGRRRGIQLFLVLFCLGVGLQLSTTLVPFVLGRIFAGFGVGGTSCLVPLYQGETSPKKYRGAIVSGYQWMITIGLLVASVVVNATQYRNDASCYRIPIAVQFIWAAILGVGLLFLPESPRHLLAKGDEQGALEALSRILSAPVDSAVVNEEYADIAANLHHERAMGVTSYFGCFVPGKENKIAMRTWTGIGVQALQQLTGINFIFYYGTTFFLASGIKDPFTISIITNVVNVVMTIPGIYLVDKAGRRTLLLAGAVGMATSQLIVAIVGSVISTENLAGQRVLISFVCIYIAFFAATWGPLAWVLTSEIYPLTSRAKCMSMSTSSNWLLNFAIGYSTPYLVNTGAGNAGLKSNVFYIWGGACVLCFFFVYFVVPETAGLSLEQVDILYRNSTVLKSNAYRKDMLLNNIHDEDAEAYRAPGAKATTDGSVAHSENVEKETKSESV